MQASARDAHGKLSLADACGALKAHGLAVNPSQMKDFLGMCGATDREFVSEAHFSAALATHPPSSSLGRWQQVRRIIVWPFVLLCSSFTSPLSACIPKELALMSTESEISSRMLTNDNVATTRER